MLPEENVDLTMVVFFSYWLKEKGKKEEEKEKNLFSW